MTTITKTPRSHCPCGNVVEYASDTLCLECEAAKLPGGYYAQRLIAFCEQTTRLEPCPSCNIGSKELAQKIAKAQRNEDHMQCIDILHMKFGREQKELADEDAKGDQGNQWNELPDVTYYAAYMTLVRDELIASSISDETERAKEYTEAAKSWLSEQMLIRGLTMEQLEAATIAKYESRLIEKDTDAELIKILNAVAMAS